MTADELRENSLIASAVELAGEEWTPLLKRAIDLPELFQCSDCRAMAEAIKAATTTGKLPSLVSIQEKLPKQYSRLILQFGLERALPAGLVEAEAETFLATARPQKIIAVLTEAYEAAAGNPQQAESVAIHVQTSLARLDVECGNADGLPDMVDAVKFIAAPQDMPPELVGGVLHKGSKLALGGSSKAYKTWSLLDLAISVAHGIDWLGFSTQPGKVLYVNFEIQPQSWQRRIAAVARAKQVELKPNTVHLWNLRGFNADFRQLVPRIFQRAQRESFALIILDPIYKLYGGTDENAAGDVAALLNSLEWLAVQTGSAIAYGCHFAKGNSSAKEAIDRISGSGVFARDPDSLLIFTKHEEQDAFTIEPILRNFAPIDPFVVRWQFPLMKPDDDLDPNKLKQPKGRKPENSPDDLLKLLPEAGLSNPEFSKLASENGISERSFYRLKKSLENDGKILLSKVNGKWMPISADSPPSLP